MHSTLKKKEKKKKTETLVQTASLLNNLKRIKITLGIFLTAIKHKLQENQSYEQISHQKYTKLTLSDGFVLAGLQIFGHI